MTIEHAVAHAILKPWGVADLSPWSNVCSDGTAVGEIWFERPVTTEPAPSLLLKLLFTSQPLSIQVHPDVTFAHSIGQPNGKTEAWYVLSATPGAKVALGLNRCLTPQQLREAVGDGSISDLVSWQIVSPNDIIFVPAGTIHAIGAGLVMAEIQQRSDTTFRLFDHGRQRELHIENAIAVAIAGPAAPQLKASRLSGERTLLVSDPHFVFERIELAPNSSWRLDAECQTWLLVLDGHARAGPFDVAIGDAMFAQSDRVDINVGNNGVAALVGYKAASPLRHLLQAVGPPGSIAAEPQGSARVLDSSTGAKAPLERLDIVQ
jgi:mannose-6-phosphate isomerase